MGWTAPAPRHQRAIVVAGAGKPAGASYADHYRWSRHRQACLPGTRRRRGRSRGSAGQAATGAGSRLFPRPAALPRRSGACATAHHWARELIALGHTVRLMPPAYVKVYVKRNKTDAADAEAIAEALTRPT